MKKLIPTWKNYRILRGIILLLFFSQNIRVSAMFTAKKLPTYKKTFQDKKKLISPFVRQKLEKNHNRRLLIFLDDQEDILQRGPVTSDLLIALFEETSPIIASSSLMGKIVLKRKTDNRSVTTIMDQLSLASDLYIDRKK